MTGAPDWRKNARLTVRDAGGLLRPAKVVGRGRSGAWWVAILEPHKAFEGRGWPAGTVWPAGTIWSFWEDDTDRYSLTPIWDGGLSAGRRGLLATLVCWLLHRRHWRETARLMNASRMHCGRCGRAWDTTEPWKGGQ